MVKRIEEHAHEMHGVPGRMMPRHVKTDALWSAQEWVSERRRAPEYDDTDAAVIWTKIRYDDQCGNGHNSFSVTATVTTKRGRGIAGGCMHDAVARYFPELAHLIPWHLCSNDGPMHYVENTVYLAGERDYNGRRAGEPSAWQDVITFAGVPVKTPLSRSFAKFLQEARPMPGAGAYDFEVIRVDHDDRGKPGKYQFGPKYTFGGFGTAWHECPFNTESEALDFLAALQHHRPEITRIPTAWSEGKARALDAARGVAVWPEATDAELSQEPEALKSALLARLPALLARFRADIEATGFYWSPADGAAALEVRV